MDTDVELEPQSKRPRTKSSAADNTSSKVWECFTEILQHSGATIDSDGGKEVVYLSEPLIDYKTGNPYTW